MNLFQLVLKQMRQRALSSWLTLLSVLLGVALAVAIMIFSREAGNMFAQSDFGYEMIVGTKASPLQLTLNTVYQIDKSPGNIRYGVYEELSTKRQFRADAALLVPVAVGDSYRGRRIIGTPPAMFGFKDDGQPMTGYDAQGRLLAGYEDPNKPEDRRDQAKPVAARALNYRIAKKYHLAEGRMYHGAKFEAVIGSDITKLTGLKIGDVFQATHGMPDPKAIPDIHPEKWTVVGVLEQTHTAADGVLYIPLTSFYTIFEHGEAELDREWLRRGWNPATRPKDGDDAQKVLDIADRKRPTPATTTAGATTQPAEDEDKHYSLDADGVIHLNLPMDALEISAIFVKTRSDFAARNFEYNVNLRNDVMAVNPAAVMREFFNTFLAGSSTVLLLVAIMVTVVAAVGILVSIYNSVAARSREIAILRALGATRARILILICTEAGVVGFAGGVLGLIVGHLLAAAGSVFTQRLLGEEINWLRSDRYEMLYLIGVLALSMIAGLVPALKAYRTPVATNLVAG